MSVSVPKLKSPPKILLSLYRRVATPFVSSSCVALTISPLPSGLLKAHRRP